MKLEQWLKEAGLSPDEFSKKIGVNKSAIYAYISDNRIPKPAIMQRIYDETSRVVTANDFYNQREADDVNKDIENIVKIMQQQITSLQRDVKNLQNPTGDSE